MKTYLCRHALLLWLDLRGRRVLPGHEDLDPYALAPVLASRFVLDIGPHVSAVETGTRIHARMPYFANSPRAAFAHRDGDAFEEIVRIVAAEGHGAVLEAMADDVTLEMIILPLTFQRLIGRRVLGVMADCNPYAKPGPTKPLLMKACRFLSKDLQEITIPQQHLSQSKNASLTASTHSVSLDRSCRSQVLTPVASSRLLQ